MTDCRCEPHTVPVVVEEGAATVVDFALSCGFFAQPQNTVGEKNHARVDTSQGKEFTAKEAYDFVKRLSEEEKNSLLSSFPSEESGAASDFLRSFSKRDEVLEPVQAVATEIEPLEPVQAVAPEIDPLKGVPPQPLPPVPVHLSNLPDLGPHSEPVTATPDVETPENHR